MASDDLIPKIAEMLGLPVGTPRQAVIDAALQRIVEVDAAHDRRVAASAVRGGDCPPPHRGAGMERTLDWAEATRRISAASRPLWETNWQRDPESTEATVRILARSNVETAPVRAAAPWTPQTASGLDVSRLPARLQAAAAAEADRGKVYRWVERYGGLSDAEVAPMGLRLEGEEQLATEVERRENEARIEARAAEDAEFERANAEYQRVIAAEQDRRRQEAYSRYPEGT